MKVQLSPVMCAILTVSFAKCDILLLVELAHKLRELRVSDWYIPTAVCLAQTSNLDYHAVIGEKDSNASWYGMFALPDDVLGGKPCNLTKELATDNDITDDVRCLMSVIKNTQTGMKILENFSLENCLVLWDKLPPFLPDVTAGPTTEAQMTTPDGTTSLPRTTESPPEERSDMNKLLDSGAATVVLLLIILLVVIIICILNCLILRHLKLNTDTCNFYKEHDDINLQLLTDRHQLEGR